MIVTAENLSKLPYNIEAEQMLLGVMLRDNRSCDTIEGLVTEVMFYDQLHQRIFAQIFKHKNRGIIASAITLKIFFDQDEALFEAGGAQYLEKLVAKASIIFAEQVVKSYASVISDAYLKRCLILIGQEVVTNAYDVDSELAAVEQIEAAAHKLFVLEDTNKLENTYYSLSNLVRTVTDKIEKAKNHGSKLRGLDSGFYDINKLLGGFQSSDLLILAARPSMGKTAFALNLALNAAYVCREQDADKKKPHVVFFSLEMSAEQLTARMMAIISEISVFNALSGKMGNSDLNKLLNSSMKLQDLPIIIDDSSTLSITALRSRIRRMARIHSLKAVFVDYLQLIKGSSKKSNENRVQEISEVTQGLKAIAKELSLPVIALSQLSRSVEQRDEKKPQLSDLRDSGSIEQDADIVMFLYREAYYEERKKPAEGTLKYSDWQNKMNVIHNCADLIIAKQRNGPIGSVRLYFDAESGKFKDYSPRIADM